MAREVIVRVSDDFDKSIDADVSRVLGWDGFDYILDLSEKRDQELQELLQPYLEAAHEKVKQRKKNRPTASVSPPPAPPRTTKKPASTKLTPAKRATIREWARHSGLEVGEKGVLPKAIIEAYEAANSDE